MTPHQLTNAERGRLAITALLVLCAITLWYSWPRLANWQRNRLVENLTERAEHGDLAASRRAIEALAKLGRASLKPLAKLASSEQLAAAQPAQRQLTALVSHWELLLAEGAAEDSLPEEMALLAEGLASHADQLGPVGQRWAERIVMRLLKHASIATPSQALALLAACDRTLAAIPPRGLQSENIVATTAEASGAPTRRLTTPGIDLNLLAGQVTTDPPDRYTDKPLTSIAVPLPETNNSSKPFTSSDLQWGNRNDRSLLPTPHNLDEPADEATPTPDAVEADDVAKAVGIPSPAEAKQLARTLSERSSHWLIVELHSANRYRAAAIRQALKLQGFSDAELTLAKRLASTETRERRQLLELAANLPADSARRLLTALIEDPDAGIRLEALTRFATSGDPRLKTIAERHFREDEDPRVVELAERILSKRRR